MTLAEYSKLPGISDLPMTVRAPFIQALKAEDEGDNAKAAEKLDTAVAAETKYREEQARGRK